jgi:hypothetical protein
MHQKLGETYSINAMPTPAAKPGRKGRTMAKKYCVTYVSGATGYGWESYHDRLDEFEDFVDEMRSDYTASIRVWDETLRKFIFWKNSLTYDAKIDILSDIMRDMRTTTRTIKTA